MVRTIRHGSSSFYEVKENQGRRGWEVDLSPNGIIREYHLPLVEMFNITENKIKLIIQNYEIPTINKVTEPV